MNNSIQIQLHSNNADITQNYNSDAIFYLPNLSISPTHEIYISLKDAVIPYSFYQINTTNNVLKYVFIDPDPNVYTVTIPVGNYNVNELISALTNMMLGFRITYDAKTNKINFTNINNRNFQFMNASTCLPLFGLQSSVVSTNYTFTTNSINLCPVQCLCIHTFFKTKSFVCSKGGKNFDQSLLCSIPIDVLRNGIIVYKNNTNFRSNLFTNNLDNIHIKICDINNNLIDFNNIPWSMTVQFDIIDYTN